MSCRAVHLPRFNFSHRCRSYQPLEKKKHTKLGRITEVCQISVEKFGVMVITRTIEEDSVSIPGQKLNFVQIFLTKFGP